MQLTVELTFIGPDNAEKKASFDGTGLKISQIGPIVEGIFAALVAGGYAALSTYGVGFRFHK